MVSQTKVPMIPRRLGRVVEGDDTVAKSGKWEMGNGKRETGNGLTAGNGKWEMGNGNVKAWI
jgi:hypothetical protein